MKLITILLTLLILAGSSLAASWYPSSNYNFTGTITSTTVASGNDITAAGGDSKFDFSQATGDFNTSAGTNRLNGNVTVAPTKTLTVGAATITTLTNAVVSNLGAGQTRQNITATNLGLGQTWQNNSITNLISGQTSQNNSITTLTNGAGNTALGQTWQNNSITNLISGQTSQNATESNLGVGQTSQNNTLSNLAVAQTWQNNTATNLIAAKTAQNNTLSNLAVAQTAQNNTESNLRASLTALNATSEPLASFVYSNFSVDTGVFTAKGAFTLTGVKLTPRVPGTDGGAVTVMVKLCDSGEAPSAGDNMLTGTLDLKGVADTPQSGTLSATVAIADGKVVALDFTGAMASAYGVVTLYGTRG